MKAIKKINRILFCADFTVESDLAFEYALEVAAACHNSTLILLHIVPEPDAQFWKGYLTTIESIDENARATIDAKLKEKYLDKIPPEQEVQTSIVVGSPAKELIKTIDEKEIDLFVFARPVKGSNNFLLQDGTREALRKNTCPLLIVPGKPRKDKKTRLKKK